MPDPQAAPPSDNDRLAHLDPGTSPHRSVPTEPILRQHESGHRQEESGVPPKRSRLRPQVNPANTHPAEPEFDSHIEEICDIVARRFTQTGSLDPAFCRFVGMLPEIENARKRYGLVREAKIIAGYFDRDDVEPATAQRIVDELASRLRLSAAVPALHIMHGLRWFVVALIVITALLAASWQLSGWSAAGAGYGAPGDKVNYPGFSIFNVSPWLVIAVGAAGGLGSVVSLLTRIQSFAALAGTDIRLLRMIGMMRPLIGIAFGLFIFAVLQSQLLPFSFSHEAGANFEYVALAFIAGFSERLSLGVMGTVERRFLGPKPESESGAFGSPGGSRRDE